MTPEYRYTEPTINKTMGAVRVISDEFKDLVYQYGVVSFEEGEDVCSVNFTYQILDNPKRYPENKKMKDVMGGILVELLDKEYIDDGNDK